MLLVQDVSEKSIENCFLIYLLFLVVGSEVADLTYLLSLAVTEWQSFTCPMGSSGGQVSGIFSILPWRNDTTIG